MAYYTALITAWSSSVPAAVTGSGTSTIATTISSAMTTDQKCTVVNSWNITGAIPTSFSVTGSQLANCVNWTEFATLDSTQQERLLGLFAIPGPLLGGSTNTSLLTDGMILASFPTSGITIANLTALAKGTVMPWWQVTVASGGAGLSSPVTINDCSAAGLT